MDVLSNVQSNVSLCNWNAKDLTCTLAPPPNDPIFIIVVALLIIDISIPITALILFILMRYACKQPKRRDLDLEETHRAISRAEQSDRGSALHIQRITGKEYSFANQSSFGKAISRGVTGERAEAFSSSSESAYLAYAGACRGKRKSNCCAFFLISSHLILCIHGVVWCLLCISYLLSSLLNLFYFILLSFFYFILFCLIFNGLHALSSDLFYPVLTSLVFSSSLVLSHLVTNRLFRLCHHFRTAFSC